ncbi:MAG: hypothetical protein CL840_06085 [Crocinitomicaceae bacterium]|nr:hypothetical protein [Crocinitomicaceae bacterium]|tara:strand:- start:12576 stop:12917 length:342 start_codon:yes stop_codon:yes gene_type:complete
MEELFDFTNYREHPTQKSYQVFHFSRADQAGFFENLLIEHKIEYERYDDSKDKGMVYYFAIKKINFKEVEPLNNMTIGQYRSKFIPNAALRWVIIAFGTIALTFALIGYIKSR